ncbi:23S rRNA (cytidine(2498)-2'-O)-methyltransferase RlmM [Nitrincola iocasae]|uniref:Ribosomal RNA large subunit methyltransferase M n=1 Tax=Nitrincola iocasae TaxID=2614693 RepID=A0A5J6LFP0_9GAMM|nr:23S rRNA (cytidine(2498)-2'-O)-methyltransferase RlmM [Nitrincola iocasae]QEW07031.1 23S rRNA (cytidine(2498)-2'-O)-methyltransferase RlmM [Nitrincola iocasae]
MSFTSILLQCRAGFESECAAEFSEQALGAGHTGYVRFERNAGYVRFMLQTDALALLQQVSFRSLVFTRQWCACLEPFDQLPATDRLSVLLGPVATLPACAELLAEVPDTTEGRELLPFAGKLSSAMAQTLRQQAIMLPRKARTDWRMHLFALSGRHLLMGVSPVNNGTKLAMGIRRLKFPAQAPSRSTLKLEEAWHWFVPRHQWGERLGGGKTAVDLGAAPGGWTWQLVQQGMFVTAVDNGPMSEDLMDSGQVVHSREDAFYYQPPKPVDWMVCDVADKPARVTARMLEWALRGWCREMIFNLKLPMKKRHLEVQQCLDMIRTGLEQADISYSLSARHLYHDREEVTCYLDLRR